MRSWFLVCLVLVAVVSGQTAPPAPTPAPTPANPAVAPNQAAGNTPGSAPAPAPPQVGPDDTVITIKGFCSDTTLQGDACKTAINKAQFEKLADALQPGMSPAMRRQLATAYARMLTMSSEAEKRSLDKEPKFDEAMRFARMQILSQELSRAIQADAGKVTDEDIQDYYNKNTANFAQATFARIYVPHTKRVETPVAAPAKKAGTGAAKTPASGAKKNAAPITKSKDPSPQDASEGAAPATPKKGAGAGSAKTTTKALTPEEKEKAGVEAMKKEADLLRARLVKGEDPDKLEKAAWTAAGLPGTPSPTKMVKIRRSSLPADHQSVMDMNPGDVSPVISDPSGNYIYKLISKETMPLDSAKTEIRNQLSSQRFRDAMQRFQNNADLNDAYFGPVRQPSVVRPPLGPKPPAKQEDPDRD